MPTNFQSIAKRPNKIYNQFYALWNEGATIILFSVVLVVIKNAVNWIYGVIELVSVLIMLDLNFTKK
jgi:putative membrane protein